MIAVKFFSKYQDNELSKTIENISSFMRENLSLKNIKTLRSNQESEIVSGVKESFDDENITVELTIKKTIVINKANLGEKHLLDKYVSEIKHFCEQAKEIEEVRYEPLTIRK